MCVFRIVIVVSIALSVRSGSDSERGVRPRSAVRERLLLPSVCSCAPLDEGRRERPRVPRPMSHVPRLTLLTPTLTPHSANGSSAAQPTPVSEEPQQRSLITEESWGVGCLRWLGVGEGHRHRGS